MLTLNYIYYYSVSIIENIVLFGEFYLQLEDKFSIFFKKIMDFKIRLLKNGLTFKIEFLYFLCNKYIILTKHQHCPFIEHRN